MRKLTTEEFIKRSKSIHGDKYDYSISNYINSYSNVNIICHIHGVFEQKAGDHMNGVNCRSCVNNNIKSTKEEFIEKSKKIHGDNYDYDNIIYINCETKVNILCKKHGEFNQRPSSHLQGNGCPKCGNNFSSKDNFIINSQKVHQNKYDYSLVDYKNNKTKVQIICSKHGIFEQRPDNHLNLKQECPKCSDEIVRRKNRFSNDIFINKSVKIHGDTYDYKLVNYINTKTNVKIICKKHGIFEQTPHHHVSGQGCSSCKESKGEKIIRNFLLKNKINFIPQKSFPKCKNKNLLFFDFYIPQLNICLEFDGEQHFEPIKYFGGLKSFEELKIKDKIKNVFCKENNINLIRLNNIKTIEIVLKKKLNLHG